MSSFRKCTSEQKDFDIVAMNIDFEIIKTNLKIRKSNFTKMRANFFYPLLLLFLPLFTFGQSISGNVCDSDKSPIIGAYVLKVSTEKHTHTNELGNFLLKDISIGDTLQIMYLGYETQQIVLKDLSPIKLNLEESYFDLGEVVVGQNAKQTNLVSNIDLKLNPVQSSQEILAVVPGLFIGQHAGGGKAEQIFLRGFDIDHGTDVGITVDGMPVNMVSHAHGQGYADLHFVIPETVQDIDFGKGPYYANKGNFTTAGYVEMNTKDKLENSMIKTEIGSFNTLRAVGLLDIVSSEKHNAYVATEFLASDGPFESSQNFKRANVLLKYSGQVSDQDKLTFIASHFTSSWDASGQVPQRAIDSGLITRFGAIDDTEGGNTSRTNFALNFNRTLDNQTFIKNNVYYSLYDFELFSNFTFFLEDSINGDQIRQYEKRQIFGAESQINHSFFIGDNVSTLLQGAVGLRYDNIDNNTLANTLNRRTTLNNISLGDVDETNLYAYAKAEFDVGSFLIQPSVRFDYFDFNYVNDLNVLYNKEAATQTIISPKLSFIYNLNSKAQLFLKSGVGFHSNDTRVVVAERERPVLPAAYGADLGGDFKPFKRLFVNAALWYLFLEQEFVYVGDAGIVEPSGRTRRMGVDLGFRWQISNNLFANMDLNYAVPRSLDDPEGENLIPLAPTFTSTGGLNYKKNGFSAAINYRWLKDRPANEDNSIVAKGYTITDLNFGYDWKRVGVGIAIENLFNEEWNETQFATESRLDFEPVSVEEIHFTPGTPFFIKGNVSYKF